jgi:prolyl oligopeptidase
MLPPTAKDADPNHPSVLGSADALSDPRVWLEDVDAEGTGTALTWVKSRNAAALADLGDPTKMPDYSRILSILDSKEKIPYIGRVLNGLYYNFWQDQNHLKGIWRRTTLDDYRKPNPSWETVLDLDALNKEEVNPKTGEPENWVWKGSTVLDEGPDVRTDRVMLKLSRGGADATEVREFDLDKKRFVP